MVFGFDGWCSMQCVDGIGFWILIRPCGHFKISQMELCLELIGITFLEKHFKDNFAFFMCLEFLFLSIFFSPFLFLTTTLRD